MQNQVFNGFALVVNGVIGLFGNRYVSFSVSGKDNVVWMSDRLTGAVYKCYRAALDEGKARCGE